MPDKHGLSFQHAAGLARALIRLRVLGKPAPLFFEWNLTFRCNLRCRYCGACDAPRDELDAVTICAGLDELWDLGARFITFGGGEPLMRRDLDRILRHAHEKGFQVFLSTNGWFLPARPALLQWTDHINLSLDGPEAVHDAVRGAGAFSHTIAALETCREQDVPVSLQCVLATHNLDCVDGMLAIASEQGVPVMFQPATKWLDSSAEENPIAPETAAYRRAMAQLIERKKAGAPVRNSLPGLRHLMHWPDPAAIWCVAGRLSCTLEPDGAMVACHQCQAGAYLKGEQGRGAPAAQYAALRIPRNCRQCWCAPVVELALIFSLHPGALWNAFRTLR
jgi:MoaA/NifB/PqqE/SkfB family radical SAM enzyme